MWPCSTMSNSLDWTEYSRSYMQMISFCLHFVDSELVQVNCDWVSAVWYQMPQSLFWSQNFIMSCAATRCHYPRASQIQNHRGRSQGLRDEGFVVFGGHERKVVEVRVVNEEGCCGSSRSAALGSIGKLRCSFLCPSFLSFPCPWLHRTPRNSPRSSHPKMTLARNHHAIVRLLARRGWCRRRGLICLSSS